MQLTVLLRKALADPLALWLQALFALGLILFPALLRWSIDGGQLGMHFATCFPAILVGSLVLNISLALTVAIGSAAFTQWLLVGEPWFKNFDGAHLALFGIFLFTAITIIIIGDLLRRALRRANNYARQQAQFNEELRERVQSVLTVIQALALRGPKAESPLDFYSEFSERLTALARASDLLQIGSRADRRLPTMFEKTIAPFCFNNQIHLAGEPIVIPADSCIPLIMAIHELCTNAMSYGALSVPEGRVSLRWFLRPDGDRLSVLWEERFGPRVNPPQRQGTGHKLLAAQHGLAAVDLNFSSTGVWCEISIDGMRPSATANEISATNKTPDP